MKYLRRFSSHTDYEEWFNGDGKDLPNVSYCEDVIDVHYNRDSVIIANYFIDDDDIGKSVRLLDNVSNISYMEVDNIRLDTVMSNYTFSTGGIHRVVYHLIDDSVIPNRMFLSTVLYDITLPETIKTIGLDAFSGLIGISSIIIPDGVTSVGSGCFGATGSYDGNRVKIELPATLSHIGAGLFTQSRNLDVLLYAVNPPDGADEGMFSLSYDVELYVPDDSVEIYRNTPYWKFINPMSEYVN